MSERPADWDLRQEIMGCKSLLLEIIRRAAYDWVLYRSSRRLKYRQIAAESYIWLFIEQPGHPHWEERQRSGDTVTSFLGICELLDLDAIGIRVNIRRLTVRDILSVGRPSNYRKLPVQSEADDDAEPSAPEVMDVRELLASMNQAQTEPNHIG